MPRIIDYQIVLDRLQSEGLKCHYYNGGAFGFASEEGMLVRGWVGPPDERSGRRRASFVRNVPAPFEANLAEFAVKVWQELLPGEVWAIPKSHWWFELNDGSRDWLPGLVQRIGLNADELKSRNNASAIEFSLSEVDGFRQFVRGLLENLSVSDFLLAFPGRSTICTVHQHKQLWWVTENAALLHGLDGMC